MIIATIKKLDGTSLDHGRFASQEQAMQWFQPFINKGIYGQAFVPAEYRTVDEEEVLVHEEIPAAFTVEFVNESQIVQSQAEINEEKKQFLANTDWQVLRHRDETDMGQTPSLSEQQYQELLAARQAARNAII